MDMVITLADIMVMATMAMDTRAPIRHGDILTTAMDTRIHTTTRYRYAKIHRAQSDRINTGVRFARSIVDCIHVYHDTGEM